MHRWDSFKWKVFDTLLAACATDVQNHILPVAFAAIESENRKVGLGSLFKCVIR